MVARNDADLDQVQRVDRYRDACKKYLSNAERQPAMYFRSLAEFESILDGHGVAFEQLGMIDAAGGFNRCFSTWLHAERGVSAASGWAVGIENRAAELDQEPVSLFFRYAREFLADESGETSSLR